MTSNSLTENEEHDIPSQILKTIFYCDPQLFLNPNMCGFQYICWVLWSPLPNSSGQLAELIVCIIPPRRYFQVHFCEWKVLCFYQNFTEVSS